MLRIVRSFQSREKLAVSPVNISGLEVLIFHISEVIFLRSGLQSDMCTPEMIIYKAHVVIIIKQKYCLTDLVCTTLPESAPSELGFLASSSHFQNIISRSLSGRFAGK